MVPGSARIAIPGALSESRKKLIFVVRPGLCATCERSAGGREYQKFLLEVSPPHAGRLGLRGAALERITSRNGNNRTKKIIYWHVTFCNYHETVSVPKNAHAFGLSYQIMLCKEYPRMLQLISVLYPNAPQFSYQQHRRA